jgi:putative membrane protein
MRNQRTRIFLVSLVASALSAVIAACASTPNSPPASASGILRLGENPSLNVPSLPASESDMLERMTDANILSRLCSTDSLEIEMAKVARDRASNGAVREFAGKLIADHSMSLASDKLIALRPNLSIQLMPGDTTTMMGFRLLDSLRAGASSSGFDRQYLMSQISMHERYIAQLQTLAHVGRDKALREHIAQQIPTVQGHLMRAQALARDAGYIGRAN